MPSAIANRRAGRLRTLWRWFIWTLVGVAAALIALYAATPWLVATLSPHLADRLGLSSLELTITRPGLHSVTIERLAAASDAVIIRGENARIDYTWPALVNARAERMTVGLLEVSLLSNVTTDEASVTPAPGELLPASPFRRLTVEQLVVRFPDTGFVGHGRADLGDAGLSLSLDGVEPKIASRLSVTAGLSRDGVFTADIGERGNGAGRFLSMHGQIGVDSIGIEGDVDLHGFPLELASEIAGIPRGTGTVTGSFRTRLPWPLPEQVALPDIDVSIPAFAVRWQSEEIGLTLDGIAGTAELTRGSIAAALSGAARYRLDGRELTLEMPHEFRLTSVGELVSGTAGARVRVQDADIEVAATLDAFSLRAAPDLSFEIAGDIEGHLADMQASGRLQAALEGDALSVAGALEVKGARAPKGKAAGPQAGRGGVAARIETRLPSPMPEALTWRDLVGSIPSFSLSWQTYDKAIELTRIAGSARFERGEVAASLGGTVRYRDNGREITGRLPADTRLAYAKDTVRGATGLRLTLADGDSRAEATLRSAELTLATTPGLDIDADINGQYDAVQVAGRLKGRATLDDARRPKAAGRIEFAGALQQADRSHKGTLDSSFALNGDALDASGTLTSKLLGSAPFTLSHDLASGAGRLEATGTINVREPLAASLVAGWAETYDLDSGRIEATADLHWPTPGRIAGDVELVLSNGRAHYDTYLASGIAGHLYLRAGDEENDWRLEPTRLSASRIDIGMSIENARVRLAWSGDQVEVNGFSGNLLGGTATTEPFVYELATGSAVFPLALTGIDLARVLALEGEDIRGTGTLDGTLPVILRDDKPRIEGGVMTARPPGGVIRLSPGLANAAGRPDLSFAMVALQDFSYEMLRTTIDYAENGDLVLAVHLQGRNPAVEKGRAIHYNLNISENVPVLLESLRLKDKVTEGIEKKVKK